MDFAVPVDHRVKTIDKIPVKVDMPLNKLKPNQTQPKQTRKG